MKDHEENYELIIESSIGILRNFCIMTFIIFTFIIGINMIYDLSLIWNISFLAPLAVILLASFIQLMLCFWRVGKYDVDKLEKINSSKSSLIFSSTITYFVFMGGTFLYILMSIILFS